MLGQLRRRWANNVPALAERLVLFANKFQIIYFHLVSRQQ